MRSLNSPSLCSSRHLRNFIFVRATLRPCATCLVPGSWRPFEPSSAARPSRHSSVPSSVARRCWPEHSFDLEAPRSLARLDEPQTTLEGLTGTVVIGRGTAQAGSLSAAPRACRSPRSHTIPAARQCLAGAGEGGLRKSRRSGSRFPRSYLSDGDTASALWRTDFIRSHLERDIPALGISIPAETLRRFWVMVSHYHGQTLNLSELGRSFGSPITRLAATSKS